ncbi:hypothetical protein CPB86DRAFT_275292 [Serendipita vermifera]|nr:hypothetical protein CPB86DRAFT_275292 [Serendipita vermifera]
MKLSAILSLASLGATATLAFPLFHFGDTDVDRRDIALPVARRTEEATAEATATVESSATESTPTPTATESAAEESATETATYLYSTITDSPDRAQETTRTRTRQTETASATAETEFPRQTGSSENFNFDNAVIIHQREFITVTEVLVIEKPVLVAVQVNLNVRQELIVSRFQDNFRNRFNLWDQAVINHLGLLIAQQYDLLSRIGHGGFNQLDVVNFDAFVNKFVQQFQVFQAFQLDDVRLLAQLLQNLNVSQLATFFGRSDALFSQGIFDQFGINNDFNIFVAQLPNILNAIQGAQFNADDLFGLVNGAQFLNNLIVAP